jgi:hypothetical protein
MKVIGNPWIVGGLCLFAVGLVVHQVLAFRRPGGGAAAPNGPAFVPAASPTGPAPGALAEGASDVGRATAQTTPGANVTTPATLIDRSYVQSRLAQWVESPRRDPFLFSPAGKPGPAAASPVSRWELKAIWQQTGSRLAAINKGVYAEGDLIQGYRLERIESDRVWLQSPTGREGLGFTRPQPAPAAPTGTNGSDRQRHL